ncbi:AAA family ATPase [Frisingicoccus sp.]|uniref:AAA family ATPase n=1 Tax=Frisingicoccus sp. TaxID=1918627 RepID=UPI002E75C440|nr:AAA family ATPase [Frisingicoccus sp.]MEE0751350.1 AAA family ATPase [Frisingicoccus sp.]
MADTMSVKEAALLWNISERRISYLCNQGRIAGAKKTGRSWVIPANAQKPVDNRIKSGAYQKKKMKSDLPLPVGVSDYCIASKEYYYVDKTMFIKDFLDERPMVSLFTRPRRFGKTLNMDMLRTFFEKTDEDTSVYFQDKLIWNQGEKYRKYQGKYPVIFITFKDVKKDTWDKTLNHIIQIITSEYKRHTELANSEKILDKDYYDMVIAGTTDKNLFDSSLYMLSKMLHEHYGVAPVVIIDEYDTPIQQGHTLGFYDEVILFMRNLFSGVLKDNKHLSYGFLTGILRVAKESIFSGLNNLTINSILENKYSEYFGFTPDEVREMAVYYSAEDKYDELCKWYDGYRFGNSEIFNPWSVINYFRNDCQPRAYWQATGSNEIIGEVLSGIDEEITFKLNKLIQGETIVSAIDTGVIYPQVKNNPSSVFSFLLVAGYLKSMKSSIAVGGDFMCEVALPNKEISFVYRKEILQKLQYIVPQSSVISVQEALYSADSDMLKKSLETLLLQSASCFDTVGENFYHGFMLGLCAALEPYKSTSNKESGKGRYDIQLRPLVKSLPGIIIELKSAKNCSEKELKELSTTALKQINDKKYDTELKSAGINNIVKYGVAFSGKNVAIVSESNY